VLERQMSAMSPAHPLAPTASEERGRAIYAREGCAYCHTQQVRLLDSDIERFGAPTLAWETRFDYPHLWGTRRIGPDLARESGNRPEDWHLAHLFSPRAIVPDSVMPSYAALFDGAADRPRQEARDLVAYLDSLGRARELAGREGDAHARATCNCADDAMAGMAFQFPVNTSTVRARRQEPSPTYADSGNIARGWDVFARNCAGCHGPRGAGDGPGASLGLSPRPTNLAAHQYTRARISAALWNGVAGTSMQAWRELRLDDQKALTDALWALEPDEAVKPPVIEHGALGASVYAANCAQCHGVHGAGDGWAAAELRVAPTSFRAQRPTLDASLAALRFGIQGTQMAPWGARLTDAELRAVAAYVRTLFDDDRPGAQRGAGVQGSE
jgi:mono/diheme cytochrome c family protein